jgi:hypothetical protein
MADCSEVTQPYRDNTYIRMYVSGSIEARGFVAFPESIRSTVKVSDPNDGLCKPGSLRTRGLIHFGPGEGYASHQLNGGVAYT